MTLKLKNLDFFIKKFNNFYLHNLLVDDTNELTSILENYNLNNFERVKFHSSQLDWYKISKYIMKINSIIFIKKFIENFEIKVNWKIISLSINNISKKDIIPFLSEFENRFDWNIISGVLILDNVLLNKFIDNYNINIILENQKILYQKKFLNRYLKYTSKKGYNNSMSLYLINPICYKYEIPDDLKLIIFAYI